jgi:hypothetical protein
MSGYAMDDPGIRARVEQSMCVTFGPDYPEGREEARISRDDWESVMCTLRLVLANKDGLTLVTLRAVRETLGEQ